MNRSARIFTGALALVVASMAAHAQTYSNSSLITINDALPATPYPSTIGVVGGPASISNVVVRINNISHTWPDDIDLLLVGPGGQKIMLMSDCFGSQDMVNDTLVFTVNGAVCPDGTAPAGASGTWQPTNSESGVDTFPGAAPAPPYSTSLGSLNGANANGTWSLYVYDDTGTDVGTIAGGWSITFNELTSGTPAATSNVFTYQGKLTSGTIPVSGNVDIRFSFWKDASSTFADAAYGPVVTKTAVPVSDGLFTTQIDLGDMFLDNKELFMEIAVRNPSGGGTYQTLSGRQRITPAIAAQWASKAGSASVVTSPDGVRNLITTDNDGNVGIGRAAASTIGSGTFNVEGTAGNASGGFGGMYINVSNSGGQPFYGYAINDIATCYHWYDPSATMWRHNFGLNIKNTGDTGIGGDPVAGFKLAVSGAIRCVGFTNASSIRYKKDVEPITGVLDRFNELRPVTYVWNENAPEAVRGQKTTGLIAEEVYQLFPEAISLDTQGRPDGIDYSRVTAISIQAIKELQAKQASKDAEIAELKARLEAIEKALNK